MLEFLKIHATECFVDYDYDENLVADYVPIPENILNSYIKPLQKLIDEHFDNPPLKFEELKVGMWVWDNKRKEWCVLSAFWKDALHRYYISGLSDSPFEENRFYGKQVEE